MKKSLTVIVFLTTLLLSTNIIISQEYYFVSEITVRGNNKTDDKTIIRELPFELGSIVDAESLNNLIKQGEQNINNLSLFTSVSVSTKLFCEHLGSKYHNICVVIDVIERWYYWPRIGLRLEDRNFSSWIKKPDWENVTLETGFTINNVLGKNQTIKLLVTSGFNKGFMFDYSNLALGTTGKHYLGCNFTRLYSRVQNVSLVDNEPFYLKSDTSFLTSSYTALLTYTYRQKIRLSHNFKLKFAYVELDPAIFSHNPNYWGSQEIKRRGYSIEYDFILDERDNVQYPLEGYFIRAGISGYATNNMDTKYITVEGDYHYYKKIFNKGYMSARVQCGTSKSSVEGYIFNRAIGYNNINLRGYELYVADGQHYFVFSPTVKYNILPKTYYTLNFLSFLPRFSKIHFALYAKLYTDIGYAWHKYPTVDNGLSNKLLQSWGAGLDLASYYDITLTVDYSFNNIGKHGFFISLMAPIK